MFAALATILAFAVPVEVPTQPGLYYSQNAAIVRMAGRITSLSQSAKDAVALTTVGAKSGKIMGWIPGKTSPRVLPAATMFYYRLPPGSEPLDLSAGHLILLKMKVKGNTRQFEMGTAGMGTLSSGISLHNQVKIRMKPLEPQVYEITTPQPLGAGEYGFYLFWGFGLPDAMYDFTVK
jgi:hypothetical protein